MITTSYLKYTEKRCTGAACGAGGMRWQLKTAVHVAATCGHGWQH